MLVFISLVFLSLPLSIASLNQEGLYLQQVKLALFDPTHVLSSWSERDDTPCSGWYGVSCDPVTRRVVSIDLSNSQLAGPFPTFLCHLSSLSSISFYNNYINSSLPSDISMCQALEDLNLTSNLLVGPIPGSLAELPNLRSLDLSGNNFTGDIPSVFGKFRRLETLSLAGNLLNGTIPSQLGNISSLKELFLAFNPFLPSVIPTQFANLTNLEKLWLTSCNLVGPIPGNVLSGLRGLQNLDLAHNGLNGTIPRSLTELKSVIQIELYENNLSGELPSVGYSNMTALRRIDVSTNNLTGAIPDELCALPLESLNMFKNRFEGTLPESIAKSSNLYELKLFNNKLRGSLPTQLGINSPLRMLDVSYNEFSGEIPQNLCAKGGLEDLILIYNSFSGKIPESLGKCKSLGRVRLRNNKLNGIVPDDLWGLPGVYLLELDDNSFSGQVSDRISSAYNLSVLKISENLFSGYIPMEIGYLGNLKEFSASGNLFTGQIPKTLVKLDLLTNLVLSHNELSGGFPEGIQGWRSLNELDLSNNDLSGSIPIEIGSLPVLNYLDLSRNFFSGKIPLELQQLKLNMLNLSNNRFSGELPPLYANDFYTSSFVGNPGLCGDLRGLCPNIGDTKKKPDSWILATIFILAGLVLIIGLVWFYFKYRTLKKTNTKRAAMCKWRSFHKLGFSEFEIGDCLTEENVIGSGSSGKVYKVLLSSGETVAVKKLTSGTRKDKTTSIYSEKDEFEVEVETLGKIRHKNIVKLWCCCNRGDSKLIVYEYMPNGSLGDVLHCSKRGLLDWPIRYRIALDAAEGLSYLHHDCDPPIVHRDVKSNNILLDGEFCAKVADFGVAKVVQRVDKGTQSMSVVAGSCGYIAPEYAYTLRVNEKSDIYSFGVVILELVTGRQPMDPEFGEKDLVKWVCSTLDQKGVDGVMDPKLDSVHKEEICGVLSVGLQCTVSLPVSRPSMRKVVKMLQEAGSETKPKSSCNNKLCPYYLAEGYDQVVV